MKLINIIDSVLVYPLETDISAIHLTSSKHLLCLPEGFAEEEKKQVMDFLLLKDAFTEDAQEMYSGTVWLWDFSAWIDISYVYGKRFLPNTYLDNQRLFYNYNKTACYIVTLNRMPDVPKIFVIQ